MLFTMCWIGALIYIAVLIYDETNAPAWWDKEDK